MKIIETSLKGVVIIEPNVYGDSRGFFLESFQEERYRLLAGIELPFVQDNHSRSEKGVLRGLHFQKKKPQGKLVRVSRGAVLDVAVDINHDSPSFGKHIAVILSEDNHRQLWIPPGYAHGFLVKSDIADFQYKCTEYYDPEDESGVLWSDPALGIQWEEDAPKLSVKDISWPKLDQLLKG